MLAAVTLADAHCAVLEWSGRVSMREENRCRLVEVIRRLEKVVRLDQRRRARVPHYQNLRAQCASSSFFNASSNRAHSEYGKPAQWARPIILNIKIINAQ